MLDRECTTSNTRNGIKLEDSFSLQLNPMVASEADTSQLSIIHASVIKSPTFSHVLVKPYLVVPLDIVSISR